MAPIGHRWAPITDLESPGDLASESLAALARLWSEQRDRLAHRAGYRAFDQRLRREWSIETGLIERLYAFDRGVTESLIAHGINAALIPHRPGADPEWIAAMISDHQAAIDQLFDFVKGDRPLSTSYIKELHALMTRRQETAVGFDPFGNKVLIPLRRGAFKVRPNNPLRPDGMVHEYCPPEQVDSEMDRLIALHHAHVDVAPEVEAAWLHHRFTQIHPFQDGNGRIARALGTLVFLKAGWFPLVVRDRGREPYIGALEAADAGDLRPLVRCFSDLQRGELGRANAIAHDIRQADRVSEAIASVRRELQAPMDSLSEWDATVAIAAGLRDRAESRLAGVAEELTSQLSGVLDHGRYTTDGRADREDGSHYFRHQIVQTANELEYTANPGIYRAWARLVLRNSNQTEILVSFHGLGRGFMGLLACSVSWFQRLETEQGEREVGPATPLTDSIFMVNYGEPLAQAAPRFANWLDDAILRGLKMWKEATL